MAITGLADLGDTIPTIIGKATLTRQQNAVMRGLAWNYPADKGTTTNIPFFSNVSASQLTEKQDMTASETMEDTNVQITPNEVGLKIILTEDNLEDNNENLKMIAGKVMGDAFERKLDQDLLTQFDDATVSLGGSGTTQTLGHLAAAYGNLAGHSGAGGKAPTPYVVVEHPFVYVDIVDVFTPVVPAAGTTNTTGGTLMDEVLRKYTVARLFDMNVLIDGNQAPDGSNNVKYGAFAAGEGGGLIYVEKRAPTVRPEWDNSLRGLELNYVGRYGVSEYHAGWIVELYNDATQPA